MQVFTSVTLFICLVASQVNTLTIEQNEFYEHLVTDCSASEGTTSEDVAMAMARKIPTTQTGQCLSACIFEGIGLIKDGQISPESIMTLAMTTNSNNKEVAQQVAEECSTITHQDRCQLASKLIECVKTKSIALGTEAKLLLEL